MHRTTVEFSTAAFRFGHSQVGNHILRLGANFTDSVGGPLRMKQSYFRPKLVNDSGIGVLFRGAAYQRAQAVDLVLSDDVRNSLFPTVDPSLVGSEDTGSSIGALDLAAMNIQRGRDHGLPDYVSARRQLGLPNVTSYGEIAQDSATARSLLHTYGPLSHNNLDMWVGGLAEKHQPGSSLGELFTTVIESTFSWLRADDKWWYTKHLSLDEVDYIHTRDLGELIHLNTGVTELTSTTRTSTNAFFSFKHCADVVLHQCVPVPATPAPVHTTSSREPASSTAPVATTPPADTAQKPIAGIPCTCPAVPTCMPVSLPATVDIRAALPSTSVPPTPAHESSSAVPPTQLNVQKIIDDANQRASQILEQANRQASGIRVSKQPNTTKRASSTFAATSATNTGNRSSLCAPIPCPTTTAACPQSDDGLGGGAVAAAALLSAAIFFLLGLYVQPYVPQSWCAAGGAGHGHEAQGVTGATSAAAYHNPAFEHSTRVAAHSMSRSDHDFDC